MKKNVGGYDRGLRIVVGLFVLGMGYLNQSKWGFVGLIPLITAFKGWCPAYNLFGFSTCSNCGEETRSN